ncbi:hypothetical protein D3C74_365750 [compost metagenome]
MTQQRTVIERESHIGPSPEQWAIVGAKAKITVTTEVSAFSSTGHFMIHSNSKDIACLDLMEFTDTVSHKDIVGGEADMRYQIADMFFAIPAVESVYFYELMNESHITVVCEYDQDDLSDQIAEVQLNAYEAFPDAYFEVRYVLKDRFNPESIPDGAARIPKVR